MLSKHSRTIRHLFSSRPIFSLMLVLGLAVGLLLPAGIHARARILIGWNVVQWFYLARMAWMMFGARAHHIRALARRYQESSSFMLILISIMSILIMGVVFFEVASGKATTGLHQMIRVVLPMLTLVGMWLFVATLFAVNYAHRWYCADRGDAFLRFPDENLLEPTYGDFLYVSFTIAVASQTADVSITSSAARRLVLCQSVLAFFFNTSALGLTINLAASLLS